MYEVQVMTIRHMGMADSTRHVARIGQGVDPHRPQRSSLALTRCWGYGADSITLLSRLVLHNSLPRDGFGHSPAAPRPVDHPQESPARRGR